MAIAYRSSHPDGAVGWHLSNSTPVNYNVAQVPVTDTNNKPVQDTWADNTPKVDDKKQPIWKMQDRKSPPTTWTRPRTPTRWNWPA